MKVENRNMFADLSFENQFGSRVRLKIGRSPVTITHYGLTKITTEGVRSWNVSRMHVLYKLNEYAQIQIINNSKYEMSADSVTMITHELRGISNQGPLDCLFKSLFWLITKKYQNNTLLGLFYGNPVDQWPVERPTPPPHPQPTYTQRSSVAKNVFMSWRHRVALILLLTPFARHSFYWSNNAK